MKILLLSFFILLSVSVEAQSYILGQPKKYYIKAYNECFVSYNDPTTIIFKCGILYSHIIFNDDGLAVTIKNELTPESADYFEKKVTQDADYIYSGEEEMPTLGKPDIHGIYQNEKLNRSLLFSNGDIKGNPTTGKKCVVIMYLK